MVTIQEAIDYVFISEMCNTTNRRENVWSQSNKKTQSIHVKANANLIV